MSPAQAYHVLHVRGDHALCLHASCAAADPGMDPFARRFMWSVIQVPQPHCFEAPVTKHAIGCIVRLAMGSRE